MYRKLKTASVVTVLYFLLIAPVLISGKPSYSKNKPAAAAINYNNKTMTSLTILVEESHVIYDSLKLKEAGLNIKAFECAWRGYHNLSARGKLKNRHIISICDFSQSSTRKRLYIIDLDEMKLVLNTYVAHGKNSGGEFAKYFSNNPQSHKSSLGFYVTGDTYFGGHGLSLKIAGVEKGFNDKANSRNIVIHGSSYVGDNFLMQNPFSGRSYGCPAIPSKETTGIINIIKDGSCLFIYHPSKQYLTKSKILNG